MGLFGSLGLVALLGILFWFGHPIWLGWGWPTVTVRLREIRHPGRARLHVFLVPVTVEVREADGRVSVHEACVFGGPESRIARGLELTLRRNPHDPGGFADAAGGWRLMGECAGLALVLGFVFAALVLD